MEEANARFEKVLKSDDPSEAQNCPDLYLEPIRLSLMEPDYSKIDKPSRPPPRPQVHYYTVDICNFYVYCKR